MSKEQVTYQLGECGSPFNFFLDPSSANRSPTNSLHISNFVRPFTVQAVKDLLSQYGLIQFFWMDSIKSHCYMTFNTKEQAEKAQKSLNSVRWPPVTGRPLSLDFVLEDEVLAAITPKSTPTQTSAAPKDSEERTAGLLFLDGRMHILILLFRGNCAAAQQKFGRAVSQDGSKTESLLASCPRRASATQAGGAGKATSLKHSSFVVCIALRPL